MLLALDIGNSDTTIGLWSGSNWAHTWRAPTRPGQPGLYYGIKLRDYFFEANIDTSNIRSIVLCSVVPVLTEKMVGVIETLWGKKPIVLGPAIYEKLAVKVLNPYEIGADLVSNSVAAYGHYKGTCIVVDFGTALTFTTISSTGKIIGVSIAPGLRTAIKSLTQNTARLFDVPLQMPPSVLGNSTITAIQSGVLHGYNGLVRAMVRDIRAEMQEECPAMATGGLSSAIAPLHGFFDLVDPHLTLNGLRIVGETMEGNG
ncbi:MAG TPA: type III pantothenate kinase [Cyclobacteriaceae bacterium]|nr:type III pantothenate kinase [Cyclobacteriaceae bacterium]